MFIFQRLYLKTVGSGCIRRCFEIKVSLLILSISLSKSFLDHTK